ncbi:LAETG motif-containing sortase-dependent surface protein [Kitasatospora sp. NPDC087861]|uniref:LAETG motif-containing sortase-dependent surface protein n=1 Tax=Kitasatospora sp. NPDC087861 TaxID=3364070 RepID=UPI00382D811D
MRSSRLLAASALVALSLGATVGAATAGAVGITSSPAPTGTATAATTTPSAPATATTPGTPAPTGTATAKPTTPAPTGTATTKPTTLPTPPVPTPTGGPCRGYLHVDIKATGTGLAKAVLVKGGPAQDATVTFENTSPVDLKKVDTYFFFTDIVETEPVTNPVIWGKEAFNIQVKLPGGDWKTPASSTVTGDMSYLKVDLGEYQIAKGGKLTLQVRLAATDKALSARYFAQLSATSETFEAKDVPGTPADGRCLSYGADYRVDDHFTVTDARAATTPATTPAAVPAPASASPSAGPHLAETGADSSTLPIALGGAAVLAAGAGTLVVLRRRKAGAHS